jgi:hypothetical protein
MDYSANGVYNLTFMVEESTKMGKPFIAVSMNCNSSFLRAVQCGNTNEGGN